MPNIGTATVNLRAETASFKVAMREAATTTRQTAQEMRASMMEARGAITLLGEEVGVHLPLHLRNFVSQLPGVAPLMSAAFSGIAVAGLGMIVIETGKKIYEFIQSLNELSKAEKDRHDKAIKDAKEELALQSTLLKASFELAKSKESDPLKRQRIQIDEDRALMGAGQDYRAKLQADLDRMRDEAQKLRDVAKDIREATTSPAAITGAPMMALGAGWASSIAEKKTSAFQELIDQQIKEIKLADAALMQEEAKKNNDVRRGDDEAAKSALAAMKKAEAEQMRVWEEQFAREKSLHVMTLQDDYEFWAQRLSAANKFPDNYRAVMMKLYQYTATGLQEAASEWKKYEMLVGEFARETERESAAAAAKELQDAERKNREIEKQIQLVLRMRGDAASMGGGPNIEYLNQMLAEIDRMEAAEGATLNLEVARRNVMLQIAAATNQQTLAIGGWKDGIKVWLSEMKTQWTSTAQEVRDLFHRAWDGIGQNMAQMLVTGKANWASFFQSIASQLAQLAINKLFSQLLNWGGNQGGILGSIFSAFGGGKAGGGDIDSGHFYLTGEHGPEIISGVNGHVFNAGQSASMMGGGGGAHYFIDARGANAADVEARVQRSLVAVHGSAVRTSVAGVQEMARRRPLGASA